MYGTVVRQARVSRRLTQQQLAAISGIEQSNISAVENNRRVPSVDTLRRLLAGCGYELAAVAGRRVIAFDAAGEHLPAEAATITPGTPIEVRVRAINAVLDLAETIVRAR